MKRIFYGLFCFVFFVLAIPASAQEAPQTTPEDTEGSETVLEESIADEPQAQEEQQIADESTVEVNNPAEGVEDSNPEDTEGSTEDEYAVDEPITEETGEEPTEVDTETDAGSEVETTSTEGATETAAEQTIELPNVLINEVNWAGSELSQADEWIELYNAHGADVDLSGWILTGCATSSNAIALADGTMLAAGDVLLIANYDLESDKTILTVQPDLVTASVSISNSALEIMLVMPDGTVVDIAGDGGAPPAGSTNPKVSMQRDFSTLEWYSSESSSNLSDTNQLGTPGTLYGAEVTTEVEVTNQTTLLISEFVSDPADGQEEWIEIYNPTNKTITLEGWVVQDATERSSTFDQVSIEPGSYIVIYNPAGQLNNGGDTIELLNAEKEIVSSVMYGTDDVEAPNKGYSLALINETWVSTGNLTPGTMNVFEEVAEVVEENSAEGIDEVEEAEEVEENNVLEDETIEMEEADSYVIPDEAEEYDETNNQTEEPLSYTSKSVLINELVSDPIEGETEWIELYNTTGELIDLTGWTVTDEADRSTELEGSVAPGKYFVIESPSGKLNNGGDTVYLYDPTGNVIDQVSYGTQEIDKPGKGESLAFNGSDWVVTSEITKSNANTNEYEEEQVVESNDSTETKTTTPESSSNQQDEHQDVQDDQPASTGNDNDVPAQSTAPEVHRVVAIAETASNTPSSTSSSSSNQSAYSSASASSVTLSGIVTATPGTFGSQIAFIEGTQLYFYYADWPMLKLGDVVTVTGELSESRGEQRIKLSETSDVQVTGHVDLYPKNTSINGLDVMIDGTLVTVRGEVSDMSDSKIILEDETGSITIVASDGMQLSSMSSELEITGILRTVSGEQRIYPRDSQDVIQIQEDIKTKDSEDMSVVAAQSNNIAPWIGGGLLMGALCALGYFYATRKQTLATAPVGA